MNIEETKEAIAVMQAFVDGKSIQRYGYTGYTEIDTPDWNWSDGVHKYRVGNKGESKYIPFDYSDRLKIIGKSIEYKSEIGIALITNVDKEAVYNGDEKIVFDELFQHWQFADDGSICGKLKEG